MSIIIHCPNCGAALSLTPVVEEVRVDSTQVLVSLQRTFVAHECPEGVGD